MIPNRRLKRGTKRGQSPGLLPRIARNYAVLRRIAIRRGAAQREHCTTALAVTYPLQISEGSCLPKVTIHWRSAECKALNAALSVL